jgi:hypothetical protein
MAKPKKATMQNAKKVLDLIKTLLGDVSPSQASYGYWMM